MKDLMELLNPDAPSAEHQLVLDDIVKLGWALPCKFEFSPRFFLLLL